MDNKTLTESVTTPSLDFDPNTCTNCKKTDTEILKKNDIIITNYRDVSLCSSCITDFTTAHVRELRYLNKLPKFKKA